VSAETVQESPEVWVGCLGCYNDGRLVGRWVDGVDAGGVTVAELHASSDLGSPVTDPYASLHGELWCFDHQGYGGLLEGECSPVEAQRRAELFEAITADGYTPVGAVAAWADHTGATLEEWDAPTREAFEDDYAGEWESERAYAEDLADQLGAVPEDAGWPASYIDWDAATRDLFMDYYSAPAPGGVWVFRS